MPVGRTNAKFALPIGKTSGATQLNTTGLKASKKTGQQMEAEAAQDQAAAYAFGLTKTPPRTTTPRGGKVKMAAARGRPKGAMS